MIQVKYGLEWKNNMMRRKLNKTQLQITNIREEKNMTVVYKVSNMMKQNSRMGCRLKSHPL